jgi:hypothetical protein
VMFFPDFFMMCFPRLPPLNVAPISRSIFRLATSF